MQSAPASASAVISNSHAVAFLWRQTDARTVAVLVATTLGVSLTDGFGVLTLVPILSRIDGHGASAGWARQMDAVLGFSPSIGALLTFAVGLALVRAGLQYVQKIQSIEVQNSVIDRLRARAFSGVMHAEWRWLVQHRASDHSTLILNTVGRVGQGLNQLIAAISFAIAGAGYLVAALLLSWQVALFTLVVGGAVMAAFATHRRRALLLGISLGAAGRTISARVQQDLAGVRIIKAYGTGDRQSAAFVESLDQARVHNRQQERLGAVGQGALQVGGSVVLALVLGVGHFVWGVALPTLLPLLLVFSRMAPMLGGLQGSWALWSFSRAAVSEMEAFHAETAAQREPAASVAGPPPLKRGITLSGVGVDYAGRAAPALDEVSFTIPANSTTALCGASGAGKSTLADVLMGLIAPDRGRLLVDGVAIEGPLRIAWRQAVAYVQQDPFLFHDTVRANILLGRSGIAQGALEDALARAGASFVLALPDGLDTVVGDSGVRLSGGERQRVALARALVGAPSLVILDEATSALDPEHEMAVRRTMRALRGHVTLVFISHRESMREDADHVIVLDRGRIAASPAMPVPRRLAGPADRPAG